MKLKETKVLLTPAEDKILEKIAKADGNRSKTNFCTNEIRKIISFYSSGKEKK